MKKKLKEFNNQEEVVSGVEDEDDENLLAKLVELKSKSFKFRFGSN